MLILPECRGHFLRDGSMAEDFIGADSSSVVAKCLVIRPRPAPAQQLFMPISETTVPLACKAGALNSLRKFGCHTSVIRIVMNGGKW